MRQVAESPCSAFDPLYYALTNLLSVPHEEGHRQTSATSTAGHAMRASLQVLHYSEEKIGLSQQIYDYVDQKIRRLDKDLKNFEGDIARERSKLGLAV